MYLFIKLLILLYIAVVLCVVIGQLHADKCDYDASADNWISYWLADNRVFCMLINFYCFTSHVYYFRLEVYNITIIEFSLWFSPLEMYNKTIIGFGFCA